MIYTPQMIVGGVDKVEGNDPAAVGALIADHLAAAPSVSLTVTRNGDRLTIRAVAMVPAEHPLAVQLVRYRPSETVVIKRGENAGHTITYHNIVTEWKRLAEWSGSEPLEIEADVPGSDPAVVIVQKAGPAAILAAARAD
jgi:hypothetical protein